MSTISRSNDTIVKGIPCDKLHNNVSNQSNQIALVSTGALNPVHLSHVDNFNIAKEALKEEGMHVVAGWLSPSHDRYLRSKNPKPHIKSNDRCKMVEIATEESDFITVSSWESEQSKFINFPQIREKHEEVIQSYYKDIKVYYLCGADLALKTGLYKKSTTYGVIVIGRKGKTRRLKKIIESIPEELRNTDFHLIETKQTNLSSKIGRASCRERV